MKFKPIFVIKRIDSDQSVVNWFLPVSIDVLISRQSLRRLLFLSKLILFYPALTSCKDEGTLRPLSSIVSDSIYKWEQSKLNYALQYSRYLAIVSKDSNIHAEKTKEYKVYPWTANINRQKVDSFLVYLQRNLKTQKDDVSSFGEMPSFETTFEPTSENFFMAGMASYRLVGYSLTNEKRKKIILDNREIGGNINPGSVSLSLSRWDLYGQDIKGSATFEIAIPYIIHKIQIKPGDRSRSFNFGDTKIVVVEKEDNVLHYRVDNDSDYWTDIVIDSCSDLSNRLSYTEDIYYKFRKKPDLSYQKFIADSTYLRPVKKINSDTGRIRIVYFRSCDPGIIYIYGFKKSDMLRKLITVPIDAKIR